MRIRRVIFVVAYLICAFVTLHGFGQTASNQAAPSQGTLVFLDSSISMRGYFSANEKLPNFHRFFQTEFRDLLTSHSQLVPLFLCRFGSELERSQQVRGFNVSPADFQARDTDMLKVFRSDLFGKYQVTIVITDGIQSDPEGGFDRGEMRRALEEKYKNGFYLYLIGVRAEFNGNVYAETNRRPGEPQTAIAHRGFRPIYFWIATRDESIGNEVAVDMLRGLREIVRDTSYLGIVTLHRQEIPQVASVTVEEIGKYHLAMPVPGENNTYEIEVYDAGRESIEIPIQYTTTLPETTWDIMLEPSGSQYSWAQVKRINSHQWNLVLDSRSIPRRRDHIFTLKVIASIHIDGHWWAQWSTEDDTVRENAEKALYLKKLTWGLLQPLYFDSSTQTFKRFPLMSLTFIIKRR